TSEIGIRMALGAERTHVVTMVMRESMALIGAGVVAGIAAALAAARFVEGLLFDLTPRDPATISVAAILLVGVAAIAGYLPARTASRVDPMVALRNEYGAELMSISRRKLVKNAAITGAGLTIVPRRVLGKGMTAPSDTFNVAAVGVGGQGRSDLVNLSTENVVALCDVDWDYADRGFESLDRDIQAQQQRLQRGIVEFRAP